MDATRPARKRLQLVALVVAWLVLIAGAIFVGVNATQDDLGERASAALAEAGVTVEIIRIEGRDAVITAASGSEADIETVLAGVDGLGAIRFTESSALVPAGPDDPGTAPAPSTTTTMRPAETTAPSTTVPSGVAYLRASLDNGRVAIEGVIPDASAAAQLAALADLVYSPFLQNDLTVDETVEPAPWVPAVALIVTRLPIVGTASVEVVGDRAVVRGLAPTEERLAQLVGAMQQAVGPDVTVESEVVVTGYAAPFVHAEAPGDGTVRISGTMPSREVAELIAGTAMQVFGPEAVINELEVGEDIDTTFSLFRLPLAFTAFAPIPQWEVTIDDNVITGALRGGATFPSGSAKLTPELLALMPVAAGILARNPTLGMIIEGHTDSVGSDESNLRLSVARAESARTWLIEAGIEGERVLAVGYGESRPIGDNGTSEGRALNRRIEFVLAPAAALGDQS